MSAIYRNLSPDAGLLTTRDRLLTVSGDTVGIARLSIERATEPVYNLSVEALHSYYAGETGVLTHNCFKREIALGKDLAVGGMKDLARQTGASYYKNWARDGITRRDWKSRFGRAFHQAVARAERIHFSLDGIDDPAAAVRKGAAGFIPEGRNRPGNMTNAELHYIATNPWALAKTIFYRTGTTVSSLF